MKKILLVLPLVFGFVAGVKAQVIYQDTITFEKNRQLVHIDTSQHPNLWQIGKPQKPYFDSAYSKPYAILTDTINPYPVNTTSSFIISVVDPFGATAPFLQFKHKFQTDTLYSGGYVEASRDTGKSWHNVATFPTYSNPYHYDTIQGGIHAFSGKTNQWNDFFVSLCFTSAMPVNTPDSVLFRITFKSGPTFANMDGWMIDNIVFGYEVCEAVQNYEAAQGKVEIYPNPASSEVNLQYRLPIGIRKGTLNLYTPLGQLIRSIEVLGNSGNTTEDVSALAGGIYYYSLMVNGTSTTVNKLVIIR